MRGIGNLFNWHPDCSFYEERFGTDKELLASDWERVGKDIKSAADTLIGRAHIKEEERK